MVLQGWLEVAAAVQVLLVGMEVLLLLPLQAMVEQALLQQYLEFLLHTLVVVEVGLLGQRRLLEPLELVGREGEEMDLIAHLLLGLMEP
jgi:hypothetical protein